MSFQQQNNNNDQNYSFDSLQNGSGNTDTFFTSTSPDQVQTGGFAFQRSDPESSNGMSMNLNNNNNLYAPSNNGSYGQASHLMPFEPFSQANGMMNNQNSEANPAGQQYLKTPQTAFLKVAFFLLFSDKIFIFLNIDYKFSETNLKKKMTKKKQRERSRSMSDPQIYTAWIPNSKKKKTEPEKNQNSDTDEEDENVEDEASEASNSEFGSLNERDAGMLEVEKQLLKLNQRNDSNSNSPSATSNSIQSYEIMTNGLLDSAGLSGSMGSGSGSGMGSSSDKKKRRTCSRWTKEENERLIKAYKKHQGKNWNAIAKEVGNKTSDQCSS